MTALLKYDAACRAVAEAKTFDEVRDWEDKAAAVREYSRRIHNRTMELDALEIRERARRRRGELLLALKTEGKVREGRKELSSADDSFRETLAQLDVTPNESSRDQKLARLDGDSFARLVARCRQYAEDHPEKHTFDMLTAEQRDVKRAAEAAEREARIASGGKVEDLHTLIADGRKFGAIIADPPWHFVARSKKGEGRSASEHYVTDRTEAEIIKSLPVQALAAKDCALFMWMVDWCPQLALDVIEAWGFTHKTTAFTWAKHNASGEGWHMGLGYWTRANPEDCWLATRGNPKRLDAGIRQLIVAPVMEHSRKPAETHDRVERLVAGPYLELYARRQRENWTTWGNEIPFIAPHDPQTGEITDSSLPPTSHLEPAPQGVATDAAGAGSVFSSPRISEDDGLEIPMFLRRNQTTTHSAQGQ